MTALRTPDFRRLWLAGLISQTGDWLLMISLPILVYQYTGSTFGTAAAFLIELAPPVLLAPLTGRLADRLDRRRTLLVLSLAQAAALTPLLLVHGRAGLPILYAVIAAQAALAALFEPTKSALLPTLIGSDRLVSANSLIGLNHNVGRLIGGPLGGLLLAAGGGLPTIVAVDAASFLLAFALIARLTPTRRAPARANDGPDRSSWRTTLRQPRVRGALAVLLTASTAQGIFVVLFVVFVARELHGDAGEIGLLRGVQGIGAIAGGLLLAVAGRAAPGRLTAYAAFAFGALSLAIWNAPGVSTAEPLYVGLFIAAGAPGVALMTGLISTLQQATAEGQRGTAFALAGVAASIGEAIGMLAGGLLGDSVGLITVLDAQAVLYLLAGVLAMAWLASVDSRWSRRSSPPPATSAPGSSATTTAPASSWSASTSEAAAGRA
jgi:predicted MFS family arabinose efflux permease